MITELNSFTDPRDGRTYRTVRIGGQVWMAENLSFTIDNAIGCYYNNDEKYKEYGRLYDWVEAMSIAPEGWHLPTKEEWEKLGDDAKKLKAKTGWHKDCNGTDEFGFSALPGGYGNSDGSFNHVGNDGNWWSASEDSSNYAYYRYMYYYIEDELWYLINKSYLFSVRCLRD